MNEPMRRSAIVTGATGGLGRWICVGLAQAGWDVCPGWRDSDGYIRSLVAELAPLKTVVSPLRLDMLDPDGIAQAVDFEPPSPIEALIVNAAQRPQIAPFGRIDRTELDAQLQISAVGPYELIRTVWKRHLQRRRKGHLIVISSIAVEQPSSVRMAAYVIGKSALEAVAECAAAEFGPAGLSTTILRPGYMETPMLQGFESRFIQLLRRKGQVNAPQDVASIVVDVANNPPDAGGSVVRRI